MTTENPATTRHPNRCLTCMAQGLGYARFEDAAAKAVHDRVKGHPFVPSAPPMTEDAAMTDEQRCAECGCPQSRHDSGHSEDGSHRIVATCYGKQDGYPCIENVYHGYRPPQPTDDQAERRIAEAWDVYDSKRWDFNGDMTAEQVAVRTAIEATLKEQIERLEARLEEHPGARLLTHEDAITYAGWKPRAEAAEAQVKALEERLAELTAGKTTVEAGPAPASEFEIARRAPAG